MTIEHRIEYLEERAKIVEDGIEDMFERLRKMTYLENKEKIKPDRTWPAECLTDEEEEEAVSSYHD